MTIWNSLPRLWRCLSPAPAPRTPVVRPGVRPTCELLETRAVPAASIYPSAVVGRHLFLSADRPGLGRELWATDGTQVGTRLVRDIHRGAGSSSPDRLTGVGGTLYFVADDGASGRELWKSDGSEAGTRRVKDATPGAASSDIRDMAGVGNTLYFVSRSGSGWALWKSNGSESGTQRVRDGFTAAPSSLTGAGNTLFFILHDPLGTAALWRSDGSENGTVLVRELGVLENGGSLTAVGDTLFFVVANSAGNRQLWKVAGEGAPSLVRSFTGSSQVELESVNGSLYLTATDAATGRRELWKSNGSEAGTVRLRVFEPGETVVGRLTSIGGLVYLTSVGPAGTRLWQTNGTEAGTELVAVLGGVGTDPGLTAVNDQLYFAGYDVAHGVELWTSDGTEAGTHRVSDVEPGAASSWPIGLTALTSALCFVTRTAAGDDLWATEGTATGVIPLLNLHTNPPPAPPPAPLPPAPPPAPLATVSKKAKRRAPVRKAAKRKAPKRKMPQRRVAGPTSRIDQIPPDVRKVARVLVPALGLFKGF